LPQHCSTTEDGLPISHSSGGEVALDSGNEPTKLAAELIGRTQRQRNCETKLEAFGHRAIVTKEVGGAPGHKRPIRE
jgi:hypothetical protein